MTEDEISVVIEDKQSLNNILSRKNKIINEVNDFIKNKENKEYERDDILISYGKVECLFILNTIDEKLFINLSQTLSNLLKESKRTDEA